VNSSSRGFSLLEVMVALAIFGLMISGILAAQAGLAASNKKAANMGEATTLARCKMTELEEKLLKLGYPAIDDIDNGVACCEGADTTTFTCDYKVEAVVLPDPPTSSGLDMDGGAASKLLGLTADGGTPSAELNFDGGLGAIGDLLGPQGGGGTGGAAGLVDMAMGIVYPMMKPMMEASIRKITVTVHWKEGPNPVDFVLCQYVTNPQSGGFMGGGLFGGDGGVPPTSGTGAPGGGSTGGAPGSVFRNVPSPFGGPK
jgi:general secretion pathway protein I